jgi:hypothetical protein
MILLTLKIALQAEIKKAIVEKECTAHGHPHQLTDFIVEIFASCLKQNSSSGVLGCVSRRTSQIRMALGRARASQQHTSGAGFSSSASAASSFTCLRPSWFAAARSGRGQQTLSKSSRNFER